MNLFRIGYWWLDSRLAGVLHGHDVAPSAEHPDLPVLVSDWGTSAQPQSRRAKPAVEPYLHDHLVRARKAGRDAGIAVGSALAVLLAVAVTLVFFVIEKVG